MPSVALLYRFLLQPAPLEQPSRKIHFTLADYNSPVLRLVTLPNLLLLWSLISGPTTTNPAPTEAANVEDGEAEDLEITPEVIEDFKSALVKRGISLDFISGAWSPDFVDSVLSQAPVLDPSSSERLRRTLILASETIYSPASLGVFSETLTALLRRGSVSKAGSESTSGARAFVAAKRVYFGVGGGVDEFLSALKEVEGTGEVRGEAVKVNGKFDVEDGGVGRVILDIGLGR